MKTEETRTEETEETEEIRTENELGNLQCFGLDYILNKSCHLSL